MANFETALMVRIGQAARLSGVSTKLIRYYESAGLLTGPRRQANRYRVFDERNVHELRLNALALGLDEETRGAMTTKR